MTDSAAFRELLKEYRSKLNLDGSAAILVPDEQASSIVQDVCKASYLTYLPTINIDSQNDKTNWPHKEEQFTHIVTSLGDLSRASLQHMKWIQWSLRYKGIAIVALPNNITSDQPAVINFIEGASFERGRIRVVEKTVDDQASLFVIAMKWDLLCA